MARLAICVLTALLSFTLFSPGTASADWAKRFTGPPGVNARPTALGTDSAGNVYVAGRFAVNSLEPAYVLMKYDANGVRKWLRRQRGFGYYAISPTMAVDSNGNAYLLGPSPNGNHPILVTKYDPNGNQSWTTRFLNDSVDINPCNLAVDDGGVYVTGSSNTMNGEDARYEMVTTKYDISGVVKWTARCKFPKDITLFSTNVAVDAYGNVYVGGESWGYADGTIRLVAMKYDSNGGMQWKRVCRAVDGPGSWNFMAADSNGNVYLSGSRLGASGSYDLVILKYDTLGTLQWTRKYNGPQDTDERPLNMIVDKNGNLYVTGSSWRNDIPVFETFTVKYSPNGRRQWIHTYEGGLHERFAFTPSISVDGNGNVYLNTSDDLVGWGDLATVKINSDGVQQWVKTFNGKVDGSDYGDGIALGANGDVYVIGESTGTGGNEDIVTIKYEQ